MATAILHVNIHSSANDGLVATAILHVNIVLFSCSRYLHTFVTHERMLYSSSFPVSMKESFLVVKHDHTCKYDNCINQNTWAEWAYIK